MRRHGAPRRRRLPTLYKGTYLTAATWKAQTRLDSRGETCNVSDWATIARESHSSLPGYLRGHSRFRLRPNVGLKRSNFCATPSGTMVVSSAAYTRNQSPRRQGVLQPKNCFRQLLQKQQPASRLPRIPEACAWPEPASDQTYASGRMLLPSQ